MGYLQKMFELVVVNLQSYLIGILITIIIYKLIIYLWNRRYLYYSSSKMRGPFSWPLVGYGWNFLGSNQDVFNEILKFTRRYKPPSVMWVGPDLYFVLTDPKHYEIILNSSKSLDKVYIYEFLKQAFGNGLLTAPALPKWKRHRKLIQPTFNQKVLNNFIEIFAEQSKVFVQDLDEFVGKGFFNIYPLLSKLTMTMACNTLLGYNILSKEQISTCFDWLNTELELVYYRMFKPWLYPDILWNLTKYSKELNESSGNLNNVVKEIIIQKRNKHKLKQKQYRNGGLNPKEDDTKWKGFLDYAIEILDEAGKLTNEEILEEATIIMAAGTDTTAATNSFFLIMLALYPEIQDKVYNELYSIFGNSDRQTQAEDLNKMVYLERVLKETMRLCPAGPIIARKLDADIQLETHILPKGSSCACIFYETHRDPEIWKDPLKFDPDRFLPEETAKRHPYAFIPFSAGPRNCIGLKYAMMAMKVVLSTILRTYKVSTSYQKFSDIEFTHSIVLRCADGSNVALEYRKSGVIENT